MNVLAALCTYCFAPSSGRYAVGPIDHAWPVELCERDVERLRAKGVRVTPIPTVSSPDGTHSTWAPPGELTAAVARTGAERPATG